MGKKSRLKHQASQRLQKQTHYGESKYEAKKLMDAGEKALKGIYSTTTYDTYLEDVCRFIKYCVTEHPDEVKNYDDCRQFVKEYLEHQQDKGNSPFTLHTYGAAIACTYDCSLNDFGFDYPERSRAGIKRCRGIDSSDYKYPEEKYEPAKIMLKATGCRRSEFLRLTKDSFRTNEDGFLEVLKDGKGGIRRWCLVDPKYTEYVREFLKHAETYNIDGKEVLFLKAHIPKGAIHDLRSDYAVSLYRWFEANGYATGEIYYCRKDMLGKTYDKGVLKEVSYNLQHTRNNVVVSNYLWKS